MERMARFQRRGDCYSELQKMSWDLAGFHDEMWYSRLSEPHIQRLKTLKHSLLWEQKTGQLGYKNGPVVEAAGRKARKLGCDPIMRGIVFHAKEFRLDPVERRMT